MRRARKDVLELLQAAKRKGCQVALTRAGHYRVSTPHGGLVFLPSTPSDWRGLRNARSELRRAGVEI